MKQSLEKLVGVRAVSAPGAASAQVADQVGEDSETEIEVGVLTVAKRGIVISMTARVEAGLAPGREIEPAAARGRAVDQVEADAIDSAVIASTAYFIDVEFGAQGGSRQPNAQPSGSSQYQPRNPLLIERADRSASGDLRILAGAYGIC